MSMMRWMQGEGLMWCRGVDFDDPDSGYKEEEKDAHKVSPSISLR